MRYDVPCLLIAYSRPETLRRVLEVLRKTGIKTLYVAIDSPHNDNLDLRNRCSEVVDIVSGINWVPNLEVRRRDVNLGVRFGVEDALSWFFSQESEGIVLEDDILPDPTFFAFMAEMLARYRDDATVYAVCGSSYFDGESFRGDSYTFCRVFDAWGWATWRRAWLQYNPSLENISDVYSGEGRAPFGPSRIDFTSYWARIAGELQQGLYQAWDHRWNFTIARKRGLVVYPAKRLVQNIGFGPGATNCHADDSSAVPVFARTPGSPITFPLVHPRRVHFNERLERRFYQVRLSRGLQPGVRQFVAHLLPTLVRNRLRHLADMIIR